MSLSELESHVFAYWLANGAADFAMVGRWWPRGELTMMINDKVRQAVRPFGAAAQGAAEAAGEAYVGHMIDNAGFANKDQKFGGTMHQYQPDGYKAALAALVSSDAILAKAAAGGEGFWQSAFAALT